VAIVVGGFGQDLVVEHSWSSVYWIALMTGLPGE
jgi:hypothetical protein